MKKTVGPRRLGTISYHVGTQSSSADRRLARTHRERACDHMKDAVKKVKALRSDIPRADFAISLLNTDTVCRDKIIEFLALNNISGLNTFLDVISNE